MDTSSLVKLNQQIEDRHVNVSRLDDVIPDGEIEQRVEEVVEGVAVILDHDAPVSSRLKELPVIKSEDITMSPTCLDEKAIRSGSTSVKDGGYFKRNFSIDMSIPKQQGILIGKQNTKPEDQEVWYLETQIKPVLQEIMPYLLQKKSCYPVTHMLQKVREMQKTRYDKKRREVALIIENSIVEQERAILQANPALLQSIQQQMQVMAAASAEHGGQEQKRVETLEDEARRAEGIEVERTQINKSLLYKSEVNLLKPDTQITINDDNSLHLQNQKQSTPLTMFTSQVGSTRSQRQGHFLISDKREYDEYLKLLDLRDHLQKQVDAQIAMNMEDTDNQSDDLNNHLSTGIQIKNQQQTEPEGSEQASKRKRNGKGGENQGKQVSRSKSKSKSPQKQAGMRKKESQQLMLNSKQMSSAKKQMKTPSKSTLKVLNEKSSPLKSKERARVIKI